MKSYRIAFILFFFLYPLSGYAFEYTTCDNLIQKCVITPLQRLISSPLPDPESPDAGGFRYAIKNPSAAPGEYFLITYSSPEPVQVILEFKNGPFLYRGLFSGNHTAAIYIDRESELTAFTIQTQNRNLPPEITAAGTQKTPNLQTDLIVRDKVAEFTLSPDTEGGFGVFELRDQIFDPAQGNARITAWGSNGRIAQFRLQLLPGTNRFYLYSNELGFKPVKMEITSDQPIRMIDGGDLDIPENRDDPIPADVNTILDWDPGSWRKKDFELFSWSVAPDVYILTFKDNETQWNYLTRLSFHQEKRHSRGSLLTDESLKGRLGWYAHDYGAEGLADFFEQASREKFPLNKKELALRETLLHLGVLRVDARGRFVAGRGAIVSVDQKRSRLERLFYLNHELAHGLFFTAPQIRKEVTELWNRETDDFKFIWRSFLWANSYDTSHEFLVINEYFGYMNQQPVNELDGYFNWKITDLFPSSSPNGKKIRRLIWNDEKQFSRAGERLEGVLFRLYGLRAGRYYCLTRL